MELQPVIADVADALVTLDCSGVPFKHFKCGVGPYGEPQMVGSVARYLNERARYQGLAAAKRTPDLLIRGHWALEFKVARPFGDNGKEAENWSVNLLHPYEGNVSVIGDCLKLIKLDRAERKAVVVVGYEHTPPQVPLAPLLRAFEVIAAEVSNLELGPRIEVSKMGLVRPVHQQLRVVAWEVLGCRAEQPLAEKCSHREPTARR